MSPYFRVASAVLFFTQLYRGFMNLRKYVYQTGLTIVAGPSCPILTYRPCLITACRIHASGSRSPLPVPTNPFEKQPGCSSRKDAAMPVGWLDIFFLLLPFCCGHSLWIKAAKAATPFCPVPLAASLMCAFRASQQGRRASLRPHSERARQPRRQAGPRSRHRSHGRWRRAEPCSLPCSGR